jgi:hypothetical protein
MLRKVNKDARSRRLKMKAKFLVILVVIVLAALPVGVAFADAKGPNASEFGPAVCADGSQFDILVVPDPNAVVAQDPGSTTVGVAMSVSMFAPDGSLVETIFDKPGNQPTVWCEWRESGLPPGFYLGGDIVSAPGKP